MKHRRKKLLFSAVLFVILAAMTAGVMADDVGSSPVVSGTSSAISGTPWTLVGWNDLGMHCTDGSDFSIFAVLPPFNTIHAHLMDSSGALVRNPQGISVTYEAVADPSGSINTSSAAKTNFWQKLTSLYGLPSTPDVGLKGYAMPGTSNTPRAMTFDASRNWFTAEGVPITPYDDAGRKNYYPMMKLVARDNSGNVMASTSIVLPVSDEMDCKTCHLSGSVAAAQPAAGWVYYTADPAKDVKLNILRLHDQKSASAAYTSMLSTAGYSSSGLYPTASGGKPVLCYKCHPSNAMPGVGLSAASALTRAVHNRHTNVVDPTNGLTLNQSTNRTACYRCHPGSATKCLRGAMGKAVASDGTLAMQCQSCHGSMSAVAVATRKGWLDEPVCQSCHTGTAVSNNGQIRYTSVFDLSGQVRQAVNLTFATNSNTPAAGLSMYRFSQGHGGLQCEACHGSPHAEFPTSHLNDNLQSTSLQGHVGTMVECTACHSSAPSTPDGGPHGLHEVGQNWAYDHGGAAEGGNAAQCQACHGSDYRGTVLSRSQADRTISTKFGTRHFWRGFQISCYACHNGPANTDSASPNHAPVAHNASLATAAGTPQSLALVASDADKNPLTLRIVSQPVHGTVALQGTTATYYPDAGYAGADTFTFAAWDGYIDSNLGAVAVSVK